MHLRAMMRDGVRITVKSRPEIGPSDVGKPDFSERVSGSVTGADTAALAAIAAVIAGLTPEQLAALRALGRTSDDRQGAVVRRPASDERGDR